MGLLESCSRNSYWRGLDYFENKQVKSLVKLNELEYDIEKVIEYFDSVDTGIITMDFRKKPNAITCTEINIKKFKKLYFDLLKKCK